MTTLRIAHAEPRPGRRANGGFRTRGYLAVLADDGWTRHEATASIPAGTSAFAFGVFLAGSGRIELRAAELSRVG